MEKENITQETDRDLELKKAFQYKWLNEHKRLFPKSHYIEYQNMIKELVFVYRCPFYTKSKGCNIWFNTIQELVNHLYKNHLQEALTLLSEKCLIEVTKSNNRWRVK